MYVKYAASFYVLTFRLMNRRLFLALIVIVFIRNNHLRLLLILTPRYVVFSVVLRVLSCQCVWEDTWFSFSVNSENLTCQA